MLFMVKNGKYVTQNIWKRFSCECKSIVTLTLNKPAYIGTCILYLSKVLMYKSFMVTLKINIVTNQHLFTDTGSLMYEI